MAAPSLLKKKQRDAAIVSSFLKRTSTPQSESTMPDVEEPEISDCSKSSSSSSNADEKLSRKRQNARLRQQRCRAKKKRRQAAALDVSNRNNTMVLRTVSYDQQSPQQSKPMMKGGSTISNACSHSMAMGPVSTLSSSVEAGMERPLDTTPRSFPSHPYAKHDIYSNLPKPASLNERYPAPVCHSVPPSRDPPSCSPRSVVALPAAWSPGFSKDKACDYSMYSRAPANGNHFSQHHQESRTPQPVYWQQNGTTRVREPPRGFKYDKQTYGPPPVQMLHFNFDAIHQRKKISSSTPGPLATKKDSTDMPRGTKRKQCQIAPPQKKDESGKLGRVTKNDVDAIDSLLSLGRNPSRACTPSPTNQHAKPVKQQLPQSMPNRLQVPEVSKQERTFHVHQGPEVAEQERVTHQFLPDGNRKKLPARMKPIRPSYPPSSKWPSSQGPPRHEFEHVAKHQYYHSKNQHTPPGLVHCPRGFQPQWNSGVGKSRMHARQQQQPVHPCPAPTQYPHTMQPMNQPMYVNPMGGHQHHHNMHHAQCNQFSGNGNYP